MSVYRLGEFHKFESAGRQFVYLAPSGAVFEQSPLSLDILDELKDGERDGDELAGALASRGRDRAEIQEAIEELSQSFVIRNGRQAPDPIQKAPLPFPLQTLVLNVTNQCNLSCKYCYEFGEDKVATPDGKPKFMDEETARASVDYLIEASAERPNIHLTFFGGETLMNFPLVGKVIEYALARAREAGKTVDFSMTTNGTLLSPEVIGFLVENEVGVTVSMDGPREMNDSARVFKGGRGSYDVIEPKVRELLRRHTSRPVAARVTLTSQVTDVIGIFRHLKDEMGFHEVGFAPVTTSPVRSYAIDGAAMDSVLDQFGRLAEEYLEYALEGRHHGFSNVSDTLAEIHNGVSKSHPCGAALGLVGVGPSGDIAPCHRFVDSDSHKLGHVSTGIDRELQADFLDRGHISQKLGCHECWARPLCSGGCYHEAYVRYGDTSHPNLHYCDWIRGWTDTCLRVYGAIAAKNPQFLRHFDDRKQS